MEPVTVKVDASGRLVIPRDLRDALGIPEGGELRLSLADGELRATTRQAALRRIQDRLRGARAAGEPLASDALIAARRAEAARGLNEDQTPAPSGPAGRG